MANVYKADQAVNAFNIAQPQGGFQVGGWYNGRQYWTNPANGVGYFSDPGVINPFSNQQGAGQAVNPEVVKAGSIQQGLAPDANQNYIQQQTAVQPEQIAQAGITPMQVGDVNAQAINSLSAGTGGASMGAGVTTPQAYDLMATYNQIQNNAGVKQIQDELTTAEKSYLEQRAKISDNPFSSAGMIDKRLQRLRQTYEAEVQPKRDQLAMMQADAETQMQLALKQIDLNNQLVQQAMSQFEFMLSSGALDNASGQDIANITRATGLSSTMIQNAIAYTKKKNTPQPQIVSYDDGVNQGYAMIDPQTGKLIGTQVIAGSKPSSTSGSTAKVGSTEWIYDQTQKINTFIIQTTNDYGHMEPVDWQAAKNAYVQTGLGKPKEFDEAYADRTDPYRTQNGGDFMEDYGFSLDQREEYTGQIF